MIEWWHVAILAAVFIIAWKQGSKSVKKEK